MCVIYCDSFSFLFEVEEYYRSNMGYYDILERAIHPQVLNMYIVHFIKKYTSKTSNFQPLFYTNIILSSHRS